MSTESIAVDPRSQEATNAWVPPDPDHLDLNFRMGESVVAEWVLGHGPAAVLRELVQNEYDAGGSRLEISFEADTLYISGNGAPVDKKGWQRLSVILGTGRVPGQDDEVEAKANGIGSKNFGLRSLFLFGDWIFVRSNGRQMILNRERGTPREPLQDPSSRGTPGIQIHVPYRTAASGRFRPFDLEIEQRMLDGLVSNVATTLLKLAHPHRRKSLRDVVVSSHRHKRQIAWRQSVRSLASGHRGVALLSRRVTIKDTLSGKDRVIEELEWQKPLSLPAKFSTQQIPNYFKERGGRISLGLSLPTVRGKLPKNVSGGLVFYPLGIERLFTGNAVSINAPFEMDSDRSQIIDPGNSPFNDWLLENAADLTVKLLAADWFPRFGARAYTAVGQISQSNLPRFVENVQDYLRTSKCWPSAKRPRGASTRLNLATATDLRIPEAPELEVFLDDHERFHPTLSEDPMVRQIAQEYGAKSFTLNSLIRLRCKGDDGDGLKTKLKDFESTFSYPSFPREWQNPTLQIQFAHGIDALRSNLSRQNKDDLRNAATTLTAANTLAAAQDLYHVPEEIADSCPIPASSCLHPELSQTKVLPKLCQAFKAVEWVRDVAQRCIDEDASVEERKALYRYLVSINARLPSRVLALVAKSPVLPDHSGSWSAPRSITTPDAKGVRLFRPVLHLPNKEYAGNRQLAKTLRFKTKVTADDAVRFAQLVADHPDMADKFERAVHRHPELLTKRTVAKIRSITCLRSHDGDIRPPEQIFLDTPKIRACIGSTGPFPSGKLKTLYKRLGCRSHPGSADILKYLEQLKGDGKPPPHPKVLYPELVKALDKERKSPNSLDDDPILWTGDSFAKPKETLLAGKGTTLFEGTLPYAKKLDPATRKAYQTLGASSTPKEHHWKRILEYIGNRYQENRHALSRERRKAIYSAYLHLQDLDFLPSDLFCLLDERGYLHTKAEADTGLLLIDDDVALANRLRDLDTAVSFVDTHDSRRLSFFDRNGVKSLAQVRKKVGSQIGPERPPPNWFRVDEYLKRLARPDFSSALERIIAHDYKDFDNHHERLEGVHFVAQRLNELKRIIFADEISVSYLVGVTTVTLPTRSLWENDNIHLTWVKSWNDFHGLLASLVAEECMNRVGEQRRLTDTLFRLISCESRVEIRRYLEEKGIKWSPADGASEEIDEQFEEEEAKRDAEGLVRTNLLASIGTLPEREARPPVKTRNPGNNENQPDTDTDDENETGSPPLPPIKEVKPDFREPKETWSSSRTSNRSGGGRTSWQPPKPSDVEYDRQIGRRGEELLYHYELERVRQMGYPDDRVEWLAESDPGADYDIRSVDDEGNDLFIEVKSTSGDDGKFRWSRAEFEKALRERRKYILCRVYRASSQSPVICRFRDPIAMLEKDNLRLDIETLRVEVAPV